MLFSFRMKCFLLNCFWHRHLYTENTNLEKDVKAGVYSTAVRAKTGPTE